MHDTKENEQVVKKELTPKDIVTLGVRDPRWEDIDADVAVQNMELMNTIGKQLNKTNDTFRAIIAAYRKNTDKDEVVTGIKKDLEVELLLKKNPSLKGMPEEELLALIQKRTKTEILKGIVLFEGKKFEND